MREDGGSVRKDRHVRFILNSFYLVLLLSFVLTLAMVFKELRHFTPEDWKLPNLIQPRFLRRLLNSTYNVPESVSDKTKFNEFGNNSSSCMSNKFNNTLLIIGLGATSEYESIPLFELLYKKAFPNRIYCGNSLIPNQTDITVLQVNTRNGAYLYDCLKHAINNYRNFTGYFFVGEDSLLNYWNMFELDLTKIWEVGNTKQGPSLYEQSKDSWEWWQSPWGLRAMEKVYEYFIELNYYDNRKAKLTQGDWKPDWDAGQSLNIWLWNGKGEYACYWSNQSVVYIPASYSQLYVIISKHFRASGVRHNIAIPTITRLLLLDKDNIKLSSAEINERNSDDFLNKRELLQEAAHTAQTIYISGMRKTRRAILNHLRFKEHAVGRFLKYKIC